MKFTLTERGTSAGGEVIEFMKRKPSPNCTDGTDVSPTAERFCQVTDQYRPPPNYGTTSYKTIHYERQTQLQFKHKFDVDSFCKQLRCWCCQAGCEQGQFILRFEFTLPKRRKTKRDSVVFDLVSTKEYEAAHKGLMYACSLFNIFADEFYRYGCRFDRGLQIGPSWVEKGRGDVGYYLNTRDRKSFASKFTIAYNRALKAEEHQNVGNTISAIEEWKKIFGNYFPSYE